MQRLLREIFFISFIIAFTLIYGNLFSLIMNKFAKELPPQKNTTISYNFNSNLKIHYPTMILLLDDDNVNELLF